MATARLLNRLAVVSGATGIVGGILYESLYTVDGGHRAIIWDRFSGVKPYVIGEGTHFRIPFLQFPTIFDVRVRPRVISTRTGTKDLQTVSISLRVLARPEKEKLPEIFKSLGEDYYERVLPSIANEVLKGVVAAYDAEQLLTSRDKVSEQIFETLSERAREFNMVIEDVAITHLAFGREFTQSIEMKQVAQQIAEKSKFEVMKAEQQQKANIIAAEGESEAARLISAALQEHGDAIIHVKRIEAARDIAETLARSRNVSYIPSSGGGGGGDKGTNILLSVGKN